MSTHKYISPQTALVTDCTVKEAMAFAASLAGNKGILTGGAALLYTIHLNGLKGGDASHKILKVTDCLADGPNNHHTPPPSNFESLASNLRHQLVCHPPEYSLFLLSALSILLNILCFYPHLAHTKLPCR